MGTSRSKLDLAVEHLGRQIENDRTAGARAELSDLDREAIAESVVQRFEVAYDMAWKTMKQWMATELGIADLPNSPKGVFKRAGSAGVWTREQVEQWMRFADLRVATAHDDSGAKAAETRRSAPEFYELARQLAEKMRKP